VLSVRVVPGAGAVGGRLKKVGVSALGKKISKNIPEGIRIGSKKKAWTKAEGACVCDC